MYIYFSNQRYRLIIAPFGSTTDAWFAVTIESMSYGGFPLAYIAKDTTHPFTLPELLEGMYHIDSICYAVRRFF